MRIHALMEQSTVNGPGKRAVLWTQGCSLSCRGCWNPDTHPVEGGRGEMDTLDLLNWLTPLAPNIEGLTISGGEPMQQPAALLSLLIAVRRRFPGLSIGMYSGYAERELERNYLTLWHEIRRRLDFAIMGRYNAALPCGDPFTTSTNQRLVLFSNRYQLADFKEQSVEVTIAPDGLTQVTGFPVRGSIA